MDRCGVCGQEREIQISGSAKAADYCLTTCGCGYRLEAHSLSPWALIGLFGTWRAQFAAVSAYRRRKR